MEIEVLRTSVVVYTTTFVCDVDDQRFMDEDLYCFETDIENGRVIADGSTTDQYILELVASRPSKLTAAQLIAQFDALTKET